MAEQRICYTAFGFKGFPIADLHCTHKYLGGMTYNEMSLVRKTLDLYFSHDQTRSKSFRIDFEVEAIFGPPTVRVLLPKPGSKLVIQNVFGDLRIRLDRWRKDDFPEYRPHVSVGDFDTVVREPIDRYVLVYGDAAIAVYDFI